MSREVISTPRSEERWSWLTTSPSGRSHTHGADDGQTGWRIHLVDEGALIKVKRLTKYGLAEMYQGPAICGTRPGIGWGLDLFIDEPCVRCLKAAQKRGIALPEIPK